jgi:LysM repeat protein
MDHHPDEKEGNMGEIVTNNNTATDNKISEPPHKNKKRLTEKETRIVYVIVATLLPLFFLSTIYFVVTLHQLSVRLTDLSYYVGSVENRTVSLEKRQTEFQGQLIQLDGRLTAFSSSPVLKEVENLAPRVNLLEKQLSSIHVRQKVTPIRSGAIHTDKRHYYEIKEGDNLFRISQKYGLSVEELARLNDIQEDDFILVGQKLVVSR